MEAKQTNSRKKGGLIVAICAAVALIVAIILLLTQCGGLGAKTVSGEELAKSLREEGDSVITLNDNVVLTEPITVVGNKTIVGNGSIILDTQLEGQWPEVNAPTWGVGCAKLEAADTAGMGAAICLEEGASLTLGGNMVVDANGNGNGICLHEGSALTLQENATVKNGRYANLIVNEGSIAVLSGGKLLDGCVHNVLNHGTVKLSGTEVSGALAGAAIYTTGTVEQTGGTVARSTIHNVYVAAGTYTMSGGTNTLAKKDGLLVAEGAQANVTGGLISECNHGLCNNGTMVTGEVELNECGIMNYGTGELTLNKTVVDTSAVYCLANNGGKVTATDIVLMYCDTVAVYNFSGDMLLTNPSITEGLDGNVAVAGGNLTVEGGTLGVCRDKSISVGGGVAVFNNVAIEGTKREKYGVYSYGGELFLNNCSIENVSSTAVKVDAGGTVELTDVTIKDAEQNGFQLDGGLLVATRVTMENLGSHGVYNNGGELEATDLTIINTDKNAIQNKDGTATIKNLKAETMGNHGAYVETGKLTILGGTVSKAAANGFYLPAGEGVLVLTDVTISGAGQQGINNSAKVEATNVTITGTQMNGIYNKAGASMTVNGAKIYNVAEHGINNKSTMTVSNVTVMNTGAGSNGIQNNGTMVLTKASISSSKNHGLYNTGSLNATDVTINGTKQNGVYNDGKGNVRITTLKITGTGEHGINNAAVLTAEKVEISKTGTDKNGVQNSGTLVLVDCSITESKNHGIYNTGSLQANGLKITDVAKNGIYNSKGKVSGITDLVILNAGDQGINNTGEFTARGITIDGTVHNGVYLTGGVAKLTDIEISGVGEHGVSIDENAQLTLTNATIDGSAPGSNNIQNKGTLTLANVSLRNSGNHGIYNVGSIAATGELVIRDPAVNGIYNDGGAIELEKAAISNTGEYGVNNAGKMTAGALTISGAAANGIQNSKELTITGSAVLADNGKHGVYNSGTFNGSSITVNNAGDLMISNSGNLIIHGADLKGKAQKAIYNAGYAEIYQATVSGAEVRNTTDATAQYLIDNNGGILDLNDSTVVDAWGTAIHLRIGSVSTTNVVIDGAGNYGIFVARNCLLSGDGLVVNNITKNSAVSGAEGMAIKIQGKVAMMDNVWLGLYTLKITGDGTTARKSTNGVAGNVLVIDADTASYSGMNLSIANSRDSAIYAKGRLDVTNLDVENTKNGLAVRLNAWATLSGNIEITNQADRGIVTYGTEGKGYNNGVTILPGSTVTITDTVGAAIQNNSTIDAAGVSVTIKRAHGFAIDNNSATTTVGDITVTDCGTYSFDLSGGTVTAEDITITGGDRGINLYGNGKLNAASLTTSGTGANGIQQSNGTITVTGAISISDITASAHGIYTKGTINAGSISISNVKRKGINNDTGTITITGDLTIDGVGEEAIVNNGTITVNGFTTVQNVTGKNINAIHNKSGKTLSLLGGGRITDVKVVVESEKTNMGNALYVEGTMNLGGTMTITNLWTDRTDNSLTAGVIVNNNGMLQGSGSLVITGTASTDSAYSKKIQNGIFMSGKTTNAEINLTGDITVSGVNNQGIYLAEQSDSSSVKLTARNVTVSNVGGNGVYNRHSASRFTATGTITVSGTTNGHGVSNDGTLSAAAITVSNISKNGVNNNGTLTVTGTITGSAITGHGVSNGSGKNLTAGSIVLQNISGAKANAVHNAGTMTLGGLTVKNISYTIGGDNQGNGICNTGTLTLNGNATIQNVTTTSNTNDLKCHGILNKGTINLNGEITLSIDTTSRGGIHMVGGSINGANATIQISNTAKTMLRMTSAAAVNVKNISCTNGEDQGIQLDDACTLKAVNVAVNDVPQNGLRLNNKNAQPTVTIGTLVCLKCNNHAIAATNNITSANLSVGTLYHYECTNILHGKVESGVGTIINSNPLAASAAEGAAE